MGCVPEITFRLPKNVKGKNLKTFERKVETTNRKTTSDTLFWNSKFGCRAKFKKQKEFVLK